MTNLQTITINNLSIINDEPRIQDVLLAKHLGLARARTIKDVIESNKEELELYGSIAVSNGAYRGKEIKDYFLNEGQALLICMLSRTKRAALVRKEVIDVFMSYRRGGAKNKVTIKANEKLSVLEKEIVIQEEITPFFPFLVEGKTMRMRKAEIAFMKLACDALQWMALYSTEFQERHDIKPALEALQRAAIQSKEWHRRQERIEQINTKKQKG